MPLPANPMENLPEFVMNHPALFAALAVTLALMAGGPLFDRMRGLKAVGPGDALGLMNHQEALVLDVREDGEYTSGHILGSRHIPLSKLSGELARIKHDKQKPVVMVCASGSRSNRACSMLTKDGYSDVYNLRGGIMAWKNANLPLTTKKT